MSDTTSTHELSNDVSYIASKNDDISKDARQVFITNHFKETVQKYVYCDNLIREKQQEIKTLKKQKETHEKFIIEYLDKVDEKLIRVKDGNLIKNESHTKAPLKIEIIKQAISEKSKDSKLFNTEDNYNQFIESILDLMDKKRPIKKRVNIKRTFKRENK